MRRRSRKDIRHDPRLRPKALAHAALRGGRRERRRRGEVGDARDARLQRVAVRAASGGRGRDRRGRDGSTATRTSTHAPPAARSPSGTRSSRPRSRSATGRARSCSRRRRRCSSRATRSSSRGRRSRSTRTSTALTGRQGDPRAARRGLCPRPRRDAHGDHRRDPARLRLQPEQPDRHPPAGVADRGVPRAGPAARHGGPRRGLHRVPDQRRPRRARSTSSSGSRTSSSCGRSARSTASPACAVGYALGSAKFVRPSNAVRQPFSVNELAQVAAAEALMHGDDVRAGSSGRSSSASASRRGRGTSGSTRRTHRPTSRGSPSATRRGRGDASSSASAGVVVRPGTGLGGPGHIRVTYGTRDENERFLEALDAAGCREAPTIAGLFARCTCYKLSSMNRASTSVSTSSPASGPRSRASFYCWRFS